jgi:predicted Rossmann fold flavoprotein
MAPLTQRGAAAARRVMIVGGGAAGFFAAITCAEANPNLRVEVLEKGREFLTKVRISGGGRCNVTHACFEPRELTTRYPRGELELIGPFQRFHANDTLEWFGARGVRLKTEEDGRVFPVSDNSMTIVDCLLGAARAAGVHMRLGCEVERLTLNPESEERFELALKGGEKLTCARVLLATGGCRALAAGQLAASVGHRIEPPVPSLFTFQIDAPWLRALAGTSVTDVHLTVPSLRRSERGPLLVTHWGLSGPAVLRLSAWAARELHAVGYQFVLRVNWRPALTRAALASEFQARRVSQGARQLVNTPLAPLSARLWEALVLASGLTRETRWAALSKAQQHRLLEQLTATDFTVTGKSLNKDEFVTCGGVRLDEVNFRTMESRLCPGLHFAGELLDIDGITGGFNFQSAWTTGWLAGSAIAEGEGR